jgi:hypothetical protein
MPLSPVLGEAQDGGMRTSNLISTGHMGTEPAIGRPRQPTLLVAEPGDPSRLVLESNGHGLRLLMRLFAFSLDHRLASGDAPESSRLLASRASYLVSPPQRAALARYWDHLLRRAGRPPGGRSSRAPLCRERILAAEDDIRAMVSALSAPVPTPVRAVALASWLLSDANGPLYNRHSSTGLAAVLQEATMELDPAGSLPHLR